MSPSPIAADQLRPVEGVFRLSVTEPMDEVAYLDRLHTRSSSTAPPAFRRLPTNGSPGRSEADAANVDRLAQAIVPVRATDLKGRDVTAELAQRLGPRHRR